MEYLNQHVPALVVLVGLLELGQYRVEAQRGRIKGWDETDAAFIVVDRESSHQLGPVGYLEVLAEVGSGRVGVLQAGFWCVRARWA